jgi:hypothetical protein
MARLRLADIHARRPVADVPDESGELLTQYGAQDFIEDLKKQLAERG